MLHKIRTPEYRQDIYSMGEPLRLEGERPDLYVERIGRFTGRGTFRNEKITQDYSLHFVRGGEGGVEINGKPYEASTGDVFCFSPGMHVLYYEKPRRPWRYIFVQLNGARAKWALSLAGIDEARPIVRGLDPAAGEPLFRELQIAFERPRPSPLVSIGVAWQLLELLAARSSTAFVAERDLAQEVRHFLDQDYHLALSIEQIAEKIGVTRSTVFRRFRAAYGMSPKQYMDESRLLRARELLSRSSSSIKEVSFACGFQSQHYFCRAFRRRFGFPPSQAKGRSS